MGLALDIKEKAVEIGFDVVGVTDSSAISGEDVERMRRWLEAGCAGGMDYLGRNFEKRMNPGLLVDNARSVICVGLNYHFVEAGYWDANGTPGCKQSRDSRRYWRDDF